MVNIEIWTKTGFIIVFVPLHWLDLDKTYDKTCWKAYFAAMFVWAYQWTPQTTRYL